MYQLKAEELRIGNVLEFDGMLCEVKEIDNQGVVVYIEETNETEWIDLFQFTPVHITEGIILERGFKHKGNGFYILFPQLLELTNIGDEFFLAGVKGVSLNKIKYLHQLQNLCFTLEK